MRLKQVKTYNMNYKMSFMKQIPALILLVTLIACGNSKSGSTDEGNGTKADSALVAELPAAVTTVALEKAKTDAKSVLLVITGTGATGVEKASGIVKDANARIKNSVVFSMNRDDAANSEMVTRFGIATVPLPFILVISSGGIPVAGGQPSQMSTEQIVNSIPSPKQDEVYAALNEKKPVFIVVSQKSLKDKDGIISVCKTASKKNKLNPAIVEVDFDDQGEKTFLNQIGINSMNGSTITVVSNAAGQITETFTTKPTTNQLNAASLKTPQKSGCAPGGCASSKGCG
jgi:hypothetical protein